MLGGRGRLVSKAFVAHLAYTGTTAWIGLV